jgi:hypothetical protein
MPMIPCPTSKNAKIVPVANPSPGLTFNLEDDLALSSFSASSMDSMDEVADMIEKNIM